MSENTIGWLTVRIPIIATTESESWEISEEYTYVTAGTATLIGHNIPASWWENLGSDIAESGISLEQLTDAVLNTANKPEATDQNLYFDGSVREGGKRTWLGDPISVELNAEPAPVDDDALFDDDGYPTDAALRKIELFRGTPAELIEYLKPLWWSDLITVEQALRWGRPITRLTLTTGGWSGNESIMGALSDTMFQTLFWQESQRGGRSVYEINAELININMFLGKFSELNTAAE